jgi:type II secretory pathway pseudopilin PulG
MTLVEIIVVVAIIGLLVALTVPNFLRAVKMAKKTLCQNNLKLLNNVKELYLFDHPEVPKTTYINPSEFCGAGNYINEDASKLYCSEGKKAYDPFPLNGTPACPHGPNTTDPAGDNSFPEHIMP